MTIEYLAYTYLYMIVGSLLAVTNMGISRSLYSKRKLGFCAILQCLGWPLLLLIYPIFWLGLVFRSNFPPEEKGSN